MPKNLKIANPVPRNPGESRQQDRARWRRNTKRAGRRGLLGNERHEPFTPRPNKYRPHQGERECLRRLGLLEFTGFRG